MMPEFRKGDRVMGAPEGSFLADALIAEGWEADEDSGEQKLSDLKKADLVELAEERDIEHDASTTKADLIELLEADEDSGE